ncbi:3-deoxy-D-manno-octulosonic acid transferase [Aquimarina sp. AD1]|uniref:3-deoxy-D-manno-octulosonic acid transferase n=1 Tax=Aquimarina sp. (strain AD1) TaxID=1714848 RepID=UPI000E4F3811|nr:glycosyltransferase N-terminal domain-containing protein [Aquimarina sp. AD1]AXT57992.1 3-deoxy-D-manno-octulosonic acid transferase [Aquimarina sp. AD1]RKN33134.1 3-deoxy-D-manno-octulosonic acid transferase [Aquimarina sp. AD1]
MLPIIGLLSPKLTLFVKGRKTVFEILKEQLKKEDQIVWFHCASLGEYEQGVPVMEMIKKKYPSYMLLVTFFSPSGYEIKKNSTLADSIVYLPIDTKKNAKRFVELVNPKLAIFVKYEFWPNYLRELKKNNTPITIISAAFRQDQAFFKWYGGFMRNALKTVDHFFVQDTISKQLLSQVDFNNVTVSGDTRFDRVSHQIEMDNQVDFISEFIGDRLCIVIGSSWSEDEEVFIDFVNQASENLCFIIAPHEIKNSGVQSLQKKIIKKTIVFSEKEGKSLQNHQVFIMNTIGYLSRVYSYGDIAYVGGAMGTSGLHNILEPATFGIPIIIGQHFEKFREAKQLQKLAGLYSISTSEEFSAIMNKLVDDRKFREKTGMIAGHFINSNTGATDMIVAYLTEKIAKL